MFKLNRHVDSACSRGHQEGAPPRCEVSVWVDIELNQEDTTGLRR